MISAREAYRKTLLSTKLKSTMDDIEKQITKAIEQGWFETSVSFPDNLEPQLVDILSKELKSFGYTVSYKPSAPLPSGCPSDQWNFCSYLHISWKRED